MSAPESFRNNLIDRAKRSNRTKSRFYAGFARRLI
jgi:hypothetical protein